MRSSHNEVAKGWFFSLALLSTCADAGVGLSRKVSESGRPLNAASVLIGTAVFNTTAHSHSKRLVTPSVIPVSYYTPHISPDKNPLRVKGENTYYKTGSASADNNKSSVSQVPHSTGQQKYKPLNPYYFLQMETDDIPTSASRRKKQPARQRRTSMTQEAAQRFVFQTIPVVSNNTDRGAALTPRLPVMSRFHGMVDVTTDDAPSDDVITLGRNNFSAFVLKPDGHYELLENDDGSKSGIKFPVYKKTTLFTGLKQAATLHRGSGCGAHERFQTIASDSNGLSAMRLSHQVYPYGDDDGAFRMSTLSLQKNAPTPDDAGFEEEKFLIFPSETSDRVLADALPVLQALDDELSIPPC